MYKCSMQRIVGLECFLTHSEVYKKASCVEDFDPISNVSEFVFNVCRDLSIFSNF